MSLKQREIEFKPRIKLNHNLILYCFPGWNVPHGDSWLINPKPSLIRVSERLSRSFCSKWN